MTEEQTFESEPSEEMIVDGPTRQQMWEEVIAARGLNAELTGRVIGVVERNSEIMTQTNQAISELGTKLDAQQRMTEQLVNQVTQALCAQASGIPLKAYLITVAVLATLVLIAAGVEFTSVRDLLF